MDGEGRDGVVQASSNSGTMWHFLSFFVALCGTLDLIYKCLVAHDTK